ncbi:MAG TPA: hypothetical protein PKY96_08645 [Flavobacteriales bacterium]|nr:hypothetical protein [Flavobacteriales bacterium]
MAVHFNGLLLHVVMLLVGCTAGAQDACRQLAYGKAVIARVDSLSQAGLKLPDAGADIQVDAMGCEQVLYLINYAHELGATGLAHRCFERLVAYGGLLPDEAAASNAVLTEMFHGSDSIGRRLSVQRLYPVFLAAHGERLEAMGRLQSMYNRDQAVRLLDARSLGKGSNPDCPVAHQELAAAVDSMNFAELLELCRRQGELPLSDRYGWRATGIVTTVLLHNGRRPNASQRWRAIWPYVADAMRKCRVDERFLAVYDQAYFTLHGAQWFGTIEGLPGIPEVTATARRTTLAIE